MHNQSDYGYASSAVSMTCRACGSSELGCCNGALPKEGDFVRSKATGKRGKFIARHIAHDGTSLQIKAPAGPDWYVDMRRGDKPEQYLYRIPRRAGE